ncbi:MAG TPA: hypothetical protein VHW26_12185 [Solirubrobacteraceae bacterium]|jgi:hypothetical protein|nr:hypothetical protein [Solirubrobacteraceae bacterium]
MPLDLSDDDRVILEEQLVPAFGAILGDADFPTDAAELELLAGTLLVVLESPAVPAAVTEAFFGAIESGGDQNAAGILAAFAVLARGDAAMWALGGVERLAAGGVRSPATGKVGAATLREAGRLADDGAELLIGLLGRPKARRMQVVVVGVERADTGGALVECMLSPPMPAAEARELLEQASEAGGQAESIVVDEFVTRVAAAAQRAVDLDLTLGHDAAIVMPIVARALTGDPAGLARPAAGGPGKEDDPELVVDAAEDEAGYHEITERLLEELAEWAKENCPPDGPMWRSGDFVGSTMLDWKGGYGDGYLGRWTRSDLAEFLLDWFPRKVTVAEEMLGDVIDCVIGFLRFLEDRDSLSGERLEVLEEACDGLRDEFVEGTVDPQAWGLAKSLMMQMLEEGVDPEDPEAFEQWMTGFNERPRSERDAIIGGPADRMLGAGPAGRKRSKKPARRKSQRAARKRNRRG